MFPNKNKQNLRIFVWFRVMIVLATLISACNSTTRHTPPVAITTPTLYATSENALVNTPSPTLTKSPKPTYTKTLAITVEPTKTNTRTIPPPTNTLKTIKTTDSPTIPTSTLTPTYPQIANILPLRQAILTLNDLLQLPYSAELSLTQLYMEPRPNDNDVTDEVGKYCLEDCAKRIWINNGKTVLTILLVKTSGKEIAQNAVEDLARNYTNQYSEKIDICDTETFRIRNVSFGLAEDAFLATISEPEHERATSVLLSTFGSIYMLIVSQYGVAFDLDVPMHCVSVQFIGKYQVEKLIKAGYTR